MSFDMALWLAGLVMQGVVIALLFRRNVLKLLPFFLAYSVWSLVSDLSGIVIQTRFPDVFIKWFQFELPFDCLLQFGVLVELTWSVLRPFRASLPRATVYVIAGLLLIVGALVWPIAGISVLKNLPPTWHYLMRVQQTFSILRILFFLVLAAGSQLLALGWRDRELQVATGLGFYSLVSLAAALLHTRLTGTIRYHTIDQVTAASYFVSLLYWAVCFAQKEAERQEFTPQMQSFLLAVSRTAKANRIALQENNLRGDHRP